MLAASSGGNIVPVLDFGANPANDEDDSTFEDESANALTGNEADAGDADCGDR